MTNHLESFINSNSTYSELAREFCFNFKDEQTTMMIFALIDECNKKQEVLEMLSSLLSVAKLKNKEIIYN